MKSTFTYARAGSAAEAVALLVQHGDGARLWAGGTDMTLHWQREKLGLSVCIDIRDLSELDYIEVGSDAIRIGAMVSLAALERSGDRHPVLAALSDVAKLMATPQTRTLATVGGNICNASPAADLSPAFVALGANVTLLGEQGTRAVPMIEFFRGVNEVDLNAGEILSEITIPLPADGDIQVTYRRIDRTVVDIALVNGSAAVTVDAGGRVSKVGFGLGAVAPVILDAPEASAELEGTPLSEVTRDRLADVAAIAARRAQPISDVRASAGYRQDMVEVMLRRALEDTFRKHGRTL
ncbi:MAG: FAD binding domain-containing protein [Silicimonas sp.]